MNDLIRQFANDKEVQLVAALIALDLVLGVADALKAKTFKFSYLSDFLRNDVLGKVLPYYAIWAAVTLGGDINVGGVGIKDAVAATVIAALGASVLNSLRDLGLLGMVGLKKVPDAIAGPDPRTPE